MKDFLKFVRHMQLINWKIVMYSGKELTCIFKGGKLEPSFTSEVISKYMENVSKGNDLEPLPMGAYEYDCCVEYLKKIRRCLAASKGNISKLLIVFDELDRYNMVTPPLEDCLFKVAEEIGFKVVDEKLLDDRFEYTLESVF